MSGRSPRSKRMRRRFQTVFAVAGVIASLTFVGNAAIATAPPLPVLFELEGDALATTAHDWSQVYTDHLGDTMNASGASAISWAQELDPGASIFTGGGSKDLYDIEAAWKWKNGGGLPDKDDLRHAFSARYRADDKTYVYFGSDRFANTGDAMQGFWFFQNRIDAIGDGTDSGGSGFTGSHSTGDILVITDFSNGGGTSSIRIYQWDPLCERSGVRNGAPNVQCADANLFLAQGSDAAKCTPGLILPYCGIVNYVTKTSVWPFQAKGTRTPNTYEVNEFFEGGIDLTALGADQLCFSSFLSETRSSTSTTATLKDFVIGKFEDCTAHVDTIAQASTDGTFRTAGTTGDTLVAITDGTSGVNVRDIAHLSVSGANSWSGTFTFHLCGPGPADMTTCTATDANQVGPDQHVSDGTSTLEVTSETTFITDVGRYCWAGVFEGDPGFPEARDDGTNECFDVWRIPKITTKAMGGTAATVPVGSPIYDVATLSGAAAGAGGTITFALYGPGNATCGSTNVPDATTGATRAVSGAGEYTSGTLVASSVGTYTWVASYSGDAARYTFPTGPTACNDPDETTGSTPLVPTIDTAQMWLPNDFALITVDLTDAGPFTGTANFKLYDDSTCTGNVLFTDARPVSISGPDTTAGVYTTNTTTFVAMASGQFSWRVDVSSGSVNYDDIAPQCREYTILTIVNERP